MRSCSVLGWMVIGALQACQSPPAPEPHQLPVERTVSDNFPPSVEAPSPALGCSLDLGRFVVLADSVLSRAFSDPVQFVASYDTLSNLAPEQQKLLHGPLLTLSTNSSVCIHVRLAEENRKRGVRLDLSMSCFSSDSLAAQCFKRLQYLGSRQSLKEDVVPGLTYQNDHVRLDGNRVLWISTPCLVSYTNHKVLADIFAAATSTSTAAKALACRCGAVECE